jgi:hypothetical protein
VRGRRPRHDLNGDYMTEKQFDRGIAWFVGIGTVMMYLSPLFW